MELKNIRNFCIIAHIDSGKSTLADRMLEFTNTISRDKIKPQMLDTMDLERERGITIKLQPVRMEYEIADTKYTLNLIDTPGHVDFSYEVSRSLAAVEGVILLVDGTQGIQAQTLANYHLAENHNLKIIPVINKIDLPNVEIERVEQEISDLLNVEKNEIIRISAKTGEGVEDVLHSIVERVPAPIGEKEQELKALIFDSIYDSYRGVIAYVRVFAGQIKKGTKIRFMATEKTEDVLEVGEFRLKYEPKRELGGGEIGYVITGAKDLREVKVGDTIKLDSPALVSPISGFKIGQSMVFASIYSADAEVNSLREALEKLKLNDSSLDFTPENSDAFGQGFRCGFLGLLHLEIVKERLEREYNLDLIVTAPSVLYKTKIVNGREEYNEPWVALEIITPGQYLGSIMELLQDRRGVYKNTTYLGDRAILDYEAPLSEIIIDFYDRLKSVSSGYASQNYEIIEWRPGDLVKLDCLVAGQQVGELGKIVPRDRAQKEAKTLALKLKNLIPKQMFEVVIQVAISGTSTKLSTGKILAREDISAMKKDVIAKLYGGDRTRKDKLLKKQAKGKKRMRQFGRIEIPNSVFIEVLK